MSSLLLRTATRFLITLLFLFSVFLLLRGHNEPGGGFVAGLVAATAVALYATAYDIDAARRLLRFEPGLIAGGGLLVALASGLPGLFAGGGFLTGQWYDLRLGPSGTVSVGTPLLFDIGVFMVVLGATVTAVLWLKEE